jgi:hypothetical protein
MIIGASLSELGGRGLLLRPWLKEKSSKEVWWSERPRRSARASHIPPCQLRRSLVLLKDAPNNSKIFLKGGRELIAFSLNKIV